MIDRRDCMRLREKLAELEKTSKSGGPGAPPPQQNSGESSVEKSASNGAAENGGETPVRAATEKSEPLSLSAAKTRKSPKSKGE